MIVTEKKFISNCLFQAIFYKIRHWRKYKIKAVFYKTKYMLHLHFYWQDDEYDYDFSPCGRWMCKPLFKGFIRKHKKGTIQKLVPRLAKLKYKKSIENYKQIIK